MTDPNEPRTKAGRKLRDYIRNSFVAEDDETDDLDVTDDVLAIEAEAGAAPIDVDRLADALYLTRFDMGGKPVMREDMDRLMAEYARLASEGTE